MSTFYATFGTKKDAHEAVDELIRGGVSPDDLSLVTPGEEAAPARGELYDMGSTVGDATAFVGRSDDPARDLDLERKIEISELTTSDESRISPIDTSDSDTDVESIDQLEDPEEEIERDLNPMHGISHSTHEADDLALTVLTGFPTPIPGLDDVKDGLVQAEQFGDSVESILIPGFGVIVGGGSLATAALEFAKNRGTNGLASLVAQLADEGVSPPLIRTLQHRVQEGASLLAVVITPGELNEEAVEEIAERHGGANHGLVDAPRYYDSERRPAGRNGFLLG